MKLLHICLWCSLIPGVWALVACSAMEPVTPSPVFSPLVRGEQARVLQVGTAGLRTLTAVLAVSYTVGRQQGAFDMVVNYDATGALRFTALKETFFSTQILFDLLLRGDTYTLMVQEETGPQTHQGDVSRFAHDYPTFRTFFLVGEAFFLPGIDGLGQAPQLNDTGSRLRTRLRSGVQARWIAKPETLEITEACLTWQTDDGRIPLRLHYADYRPYGAYYLPHHIILRDRRAGFRAVSVVKQLDINLPLPDDVFRAPLPTS